MPPPDASAISASARRWSSTSSSGVFSTVASTRPVLARMYGESHSANSAASLTTPRQSALGLPDVAEVTASSGTGTPHGDSQHEHVEPDRHRRRAGHAHCPGARDDIRQLSPQGASNLHTSAPTDGQEPERGH